MTTGTPPGVPLFCLRLSQATSASEGPLGAEWRGSCRSPAPPHGQGGLGELGRCPPPAPGRSAAPAQALSGGRSAPRGWGGWSRASPPAAAPAPSLTVEPHRELPAAAVVLHADGAGGLGRAERGGVGHGRAGHGAPAPAAPQTMLGRDGQEISWESRGAPPPIAARRFCFDTFRAALKGTPPPSAQLRSRLVRLGVRPPSPLLVGPRHLPRVPSAALLLVVSPARTETSPAPASTYPAAA